MENQLWNLFLETGDPMSYLLYKAGEKNVKNEESEKNKTKPAGGTPPASV